MSETTEPRTTTAASSSARAAGGSRPRGSLLPVPDAPGAEREPVAPEVDAVAEPEAPAAEAEEQRRSALAGKRVIFMRELGGSRTAPNAEMWVLLVDSDGQPQLYDGDADQARSAALDAEVNAAIAEECRKRPGEISVAAVPAASWAPEPARPREVKTTWAFGRS